MLYDAGASATPVEVFRALEAGGVPFQEAQYWVLRADSEGLLDEGPDSSLVPERRLTTKSRELVESARRRRSNRSHRRRAALNGVLAWADERGGNLQGFPESEYAWADGMQVTFEEAAEAVLELHEDGLVEASITSALGRPVVRADVQIRPEGKTCVDDYAGDVIAYRNARSQGRDGGQTVNIHHNVGAIAVAAHGSTAISRFEGMDVAAIRQLGEALDSAQGLLNLPTELEEQLEEQAAALRVAEDPGRVRVALRWVADLATQTTAGGLGAVLGHQALQLLEQMPPM